MDTNDRIDQPGAAVAPEPKGSKALLALAVAAVLGSAACAGVALGVGTGQGLSATAMLAGEPRPGLPEMTDAEGLELLDAQEREVRTSSAGLAKKSSGHVMWSAGADGTFLEAGQQLAGAMGVEVVEGLPREGEPGSECAPSGRDSEDVAAQFCAYAPDQLSVNDAIDSYQALIESPSYLDIVRHELAHRSIFLRCGPDPEMDRGIEEAVANSYAVAYLGAIEEQVIAYTGEDSEYAMTPLSRLAAQRIHDGYCG